MAVVRCSEISGMSAARRPCRASRRSPATSPRAHPGGYPKQTKVYLVSMGEMPARLTDEQLAELQRWADGLLAQGADGDLGTFAQAIASLREEAERIRAGRSASSAHGAEMASLRRQAESAVENGARTRCARLRERCSCSVTTSPCNGGITRGAPGTTPTGAAPRRGWGCVRGSPSWRSCPAVSPVRSTRQAWRQRSSARPVSPRSRSPSEETRATSRPPVGGSTDVRCPHA